MALKYYGQYIVADTEAELLAMVPQVGQIGYPVDTKIRLLYGSSWQPNSAVSVLRGQATVNCAATGTTTIYTFPGTSFRFIPLGAHVEVLTLSGTTIIAPSISVGTNATNYNNLFTSSALVGTLNGVGLVQANALTLAAVVTPLTGSTAITAKVNIAATGNTAYTVRIDVFGYWEV